MHTEFNKDFFKGLLLSGSLTNAIDYLARFPEQAQLHDKYLTLFQKEQYLVFDVGSYLNEILLIYQKYYQEVFYLHTEPEQAVETMKKRFIRFFHITNTKSTENDFDEIEENQITHAFTSRGFYFLGGKTGGYYGPYVWRRTRPQTYCVELPSGITQYRVNLLEDFLSKSWLFYLSFGEIGTGGWSNGDGIINCVKDSYDLQSEAFTVSLLKHEAQHAVDLSKYENMTQHQLEYRAKLIELIYSQERNLLPFFLETAQNADQTDLEKNENGHLTASVQIAEEFSEILNADNKSPASLSIPEIQTIAKELFKQSCKSLI